MLLIFGWILDRKGILMVWSCKALIARAKCFAWIGRHLIDDTTMAVYKMLVFFLTKLSFWTSKNLLIFMHSLKLFMFWEESLIASQKINAWQFYRKLQVPPWMRRRWQRDHPPPQNTSPARYKNLYQKTNNVRFCAFKTSFLHILSFSTINS